MVNPTKEKQGTKDGYWARNRWRGRITLFPPRLWGHVLIGVVDIADHMEKRVEGNSAPTVL